MAERDEINEQLAKTEQRLDREGKAWEKRVSKAERERMAAVPAELKKLLAALCAEGLTGGTSNRVSECIAAGYPDDLTMRVLARVLAEAGEDMPFHMTEWPYKRGQKRVKPELERQVRFWLTGFLREREAQS